MKDFFEKYKEFKSNRRLVGLAKLLLWLVFFAIVIAIYYIPTGSNKPSEYNNSNYNEPISKIEEDVNDKYAYSYKINNKEYTGIFYENNIELIGDTCSFYITTDKVLMDHENCVIPDYTYLNISIVEELRNNLELDSTTSYKDGKEEYKYTSENNISLIYIKNKDEWIDANIVFEDKEISIHYYDFNNVSLSLDSDKYLYELKEVKNEY